MAINFDFPGCPGTIEWNHWSSETVPNDYPFRTLKITDPAAYIKKILGYTPSSGYFPVCNNDEDVLRVCKALKLELEHKTISKMREDEFDVGDYVILCHSSENFNKYMEEIVGKEVKILTINNGHITFDGDLGFDWDLKCGHFKKKTGSASISVEQPPLCKKGDYATILKSSSNWGSGMDKYIGKVVKINFIDSSGRIEFEGGDHYSWQLINGHYRKSTPEEIISLSKPKDESSYSSTRDSCYIGPEKGFLTKQDDKWYWSGSCGVFQKIDTHKLSIQLKTLGYNNLGGCFPFCKTKVDLLEYCIALNKMYGDITMAALTPDKTYDIDRFKGTVIKDDSGWWWSLIGDTYSNLWKILHIDEINVYISQITGKSITERREFPRCISSGDLRKVLDTLRTRAQIYKETPKEDSLEFKVGNIISFGIHQGTIKDASSGYFWDNRRGSNEEPFTLAKVPDKFKFQEKILGYKTSGGFPFCKSLEDFIKLIKALQNEIKLKDVTGGYKTSMFDSSGYEDAMPAQSVEREIRSEIIDGLDTVKPILIKVPSI